jgi:hypothetical protein
VSNRSATILGILSAICIAPLHLALSSMSIEPSIDSLAEACIYLAASFLIFLPYASLAGLIVGVPIYFAAKKIGIVTWWMAAIAGSIAGACAAFAVFGNTAIPIHFLTYVLLGTSSGLAFWLVRSVAMREGF